MLRDCPSSSFVASTANQIKRSIHVLGPGSSGGKEVERRRRGRQQRKELAKNDGDMASTHRRGRDFLTDDASGHYVSTKRSRHASAARRTALGESQFGLLHWRAAPPMKNLLRMLRARGAFGDAASLTWKVGTRGTTPRSDTNQSWECRLGLVHYREPSLLKRGSAG